MRDKKVADKVRKYKQPLDSDEQGIQRYLQSHQEKSPGPDTQYVGIEVECYSKMSRISLQKLFFKYDLEEFVMIGSDSTIRPPSEGGDYDPDETDDYTIWNTFELRLLIPQPRLGPILKQFGRVFRMARLNTNESCGLHVHLDMRQRDLDTCYGRLRRFQNALFAIVEEDRWNNEYCQQNPDDDTDHYMGINRLAYNEHQTIEIRMHHGCVDTNKIEKWVRLLINVISKKDVPEVNTKKDALKWKGLNKKLRHYVRSNMKDRWFREKEGYEF